MSESLHTKIYNHLLDRVRDIRAHELDYDRHTDRATVNDKGKLHAPGAVEIGPGVAIFEESQQRREGRPREIVEWSWLARFGFDVSIDTSAVLDTLSKDTLVLEDRDVGTKPFRAVLLSIAASEQPRQSEETGTHFEAEFQVELQRI